MSSIIDGIRSEARRIEVESYRSAQGHFAAQGPWINLNYALGVPSAVLAAVAGATAFSKINHSEIVAGTISMTVAILTAASTVLDPNKKASAHTNAGKAYRALYNEIRMFNHSEAMMLTDTNSAQEGRLSGKIERAGRE